MEQHSSGSSIPKPKTPGLLRVSKRCKICQNLPYLNEITTVLLEGQMTYREIIEKWGDKFTPPLTPTNINSHKNHCNPKKAAEIDAKKRELSLVDLDPAVVELYKQKYDETLNKIKTVSLLYEARVKNLWELLAYKKSIENINASERSVADRKTLKDLTISIDEIMRGLTKDLLTHVKIEQGPGTVNVNIAMVQNFKEGVTKFIEDFVEVLIEEIDDPLIQNRIKERFVEKLDERILPLLDPKKAIIVDAKIVYDENEE